MASWLKRLIGAGDAPAHDSKSRVGAPARTIAPAQFEAPPAGTAVQVPLISALGGVAGFEFRLPAVIEARLRSRQDAVAQSAHAIALLTAMRPTIRAGRVAVTQLPTETVARDAVRKLLDGVHLVVDPADESAHAPPELDALRGNGARLGRAAGPSGDIESDAIGFDFLVLRNGSGGSGDLMEQLQRSRTAQATLPVLVSGVEDFDELEQVLAQGAWLASVPSQSRSATTRAAPPRPAVTHICQVLSRLREEEHASEVARQLGADVSLSYRLLRYVNSPAFGLSRNVASIEEAVLLVGHAGLHRWLCIALLASTDGRRVSRALQEVSLARARLLETLATHAGRDPPQALFTVGLLSILDALLQRPMAEILEPLHLPDQALQALVHARGPWSDYLALARDLESAQLDRAAERSQGFGGLDVVLRASTDAWAWAAEMSRSLHA
jgi:c-di-GMP phosphodiesterase